MTLPLLDYPVKSQNQRVKGFEVPGEEQPRIFSVETSPDSQEIETLILASYRRIFNEQQLISSNRDRFAESQLRARQITVRGFVRSLLLSDSFRRRNYDCNNNYRFAQMCVQRVLGRDVYDQRESFAWSTVIATQGLAGFIDALLSSSEYLETFGEDTVPYQRRRVLPQRATGDLPFERMPRYGFDYLAQLQDLGNDFSADRVLPNQGRYIGLPPEMLGKIGKAITVSGAALLAILALSVVLSWFGWIQI